MSLPVTFQKEKLAGQFSNTPWIEHSGQTPDELEPAILALEEKGESRDLIKARSLELIANRGRISVDPNDIFQDKLMAGKLMTRQRRRWENEVIDTLLKQETEELTACWKQMGAYRGGGDYGHTSPNSELMLSVGLIGLLERVETAASREGLTEAQKNFYESCRITLGALMTLACRLSDAIRPYNKENADALAKLSRGAPETTYEAMQLLILYFFFHEYVGGTRVRTLGRLDMLLEPFYRKDLAEGRYTEEELREMLRFFLFKFWNAKVPFDLPFCVGGSDDHGNEITGDVSYLIVNTYSELNIYSPKIHVRVSEKTPADFIKLILNCIRSGKSSFVFINEQICFEALRRVGIEEADARRFVPIGCYEPAVWGVEVGCTGNAGINLAKAVEFVFTNGRDFRSGTVSGVETGALENIQSFDGFLSAVKQQVAYMADRVTDYVCAIEQQYRRINPDPLLSCQYDRSVELGLDLYEGGAKYNNSSVYFYFIATLVDSLCAVKRLVFEEGIYTLTEFGEILKNNWNGREADRLRALRLKEKYGAGNPLADRIAADFSEYCAGLINNRPNGRCGVFKSSLFSIDRCFYCAGKTMATPDGRRAEDILSKNLCATVGMDRNGVTALIHSVTEIDHASFPNGSVLDIVLHPSAVSGEEGLHAFYGILMTYFKRGGFALHGNVFDAETLKKAQRDPDSYRNLQVRVCGWNAYFVNLSAEEQNAFIRQAEVGAC